MPTGYTAAISDGITFKEYALSCARAFGALITMRDDPQDAPIPDKIEPWAHYIESLNDAKASLGELLAYTDEDKVRESNKSNKVNFDYWNEQKQKNDDLKAKYVAMLAQVDAYQAPSEDHVEFKKFMRSQIEDSIKFDCGDYYKTPPEAQSAEKWYTSALESAERDVEYYERNWRDEVKRSEDRTRWIQQLKESLE